MSLVVVVVVVVVVLTEPLGLPIGFPLVSFLNIYLDNRVAFICLRPYS